MKKIIFLLLLPLFLFATDDTVVTIKKLEDIKEKKTQDKEIKKDPEELDLKTDENEDIDLKEDNEDLKEDARENIKEDITPTKDLTFNGILTKKNYIFEKKNNYYYLWVKKTGNIQSIGLITPRQKWRLKRTYFIRSKQKITEQTNNTVYYKNKPLTNKLNLLTSSQTETHPLLGKSYKIAFPANIVFGYKKTYGKKKIIPGKTHIYIRSYEENYCQGKYKDNLVLVPNFNIKYKEIGNLSLVKKEKNDNTLTLTFAYTNTDLDIKEILIEESGETYSLFNPSESNYEEKLCIDKCLTLSYWKYNELIPAFLIEFSLKLSLKENRNLVLKIKHEEATASYQINI